MRLRPLRNEKDYDAALSKSKRLFEELGIQKMAEQIAGWMREAGCPNSTEPPKQ